MPGSKHGTVAALGFGREGPRAPRSEPTTHRQRQTDMRTWSLGIATVVALMVCADCAGTSGSTASPASTAGHAQAGTSTATSAGPSEDPGATPGPISGCDAGSDSIVACPPLGGRFLTYTEQSSGRTVRVRVGTTVVISLPGGRAGGYVPPVSSSQILQRVSVSGGYPSPLPARALFTATGVGVADLTSQTDFTCLHSTPSCLPAQLSWTLRVLVITRADTPTWWAPPTWRLASEPRVPNASAD